MKEMILFMLVVLLPLSFLYADDIAKKTDDSSGMITGGQNNGNMLTGGGPDAFGYRWKDSNDAGGPVFNWIDISGIGTPISSWPHGGTDPDDGYTDLIPMGMTFTYYGIDYTDIMFCTNGWASFLAQTSGYYNNTTIPDAGNPNGYLAPEWDDLYDRVGSQCYYYYDSDANRFIISWDNIEYRSTPYNPHSFQLILNGNDSTIIFQYGVGTYQTSSTVGIENETGTVGLQVAYNTPYLASNMAIMFFRPPTLAHDVGVNVILSPGSISFKDSSYTVSSNVKNFGNNTETNVAVGFIIKDTTGATVYNHTYTISNLPPDAESTATFTAWIPGERFTHTMKSFTSLGSDLDRTNDTTRATTYTYAYHGSGGPVGHWTYADQNSGGQPFSWFEIAGVGESINFTSRDDANSGLIDMGTTFSYFGNTYTSIAISTNGWLSFTDSTSTGITNTEMPNAELPNALIALLWDDLYVPTTGAVYKYYDAGTNQFIVEYDSVEFFGSGGPDCIKMEAIFNTNTGSIKMQYGLFCDSSQSDITIGIEDETGTIGLAFNNNGELSQIPTTGLAITWIYTPPSHDIKPTTFLAPPLSGLTGQPIIPQVTFKNNGAVDESNVPVRLLITPGTYNNSQSIPLIDSGLTANVSFASFTPTEAGVYTLTAISQLSTDIDHSNDTLRMTYTVYDALLDFEANDGGLEASGDWQWGAPTSGPNAAYSGQNCWATILDGNYHNSTTSLLQFNLNIGANNPSLSFAHWYHTENGYDGGNFRISIDGGSNWIAISPIGGYDAPSNSANPLYPDSIFTGSHESWEVVTFPLSDYAGQAVLAQLAFGADGSLNYPGWYIDDLAMISCSVSFPTMVISPSSITGSAPAGGSTSVPLTVSNTGAGPLFFSAAATQDVTLPLAAKNNNNSPLGYRTMVDKNGSKTYSEPYYPPVIQSQGGPDAFGNRWIDSDEPGGPVFNWVDITSTGTQITDLGDDTNSGPYSMGFNFYFYGNAYNSFRFCTNGFISFTSTVTAYNNQTIPSNAEPFNLVAPFWDDQTFTSSGTAYYYTNSESLVVSWIDVPHLTSGGPYTYQIIILASGEMIFQYQTMNTPIDNSTIGIQNGDGTDGLQIAYNQAYLHDAMAILFTAPTRWLSIDVNSGSIPPGGNPVIINVGLDATDLSAGTYTGNIIIDSNDPNQAHVTIPVTFTVTGGGGNCVYMIGDINGNGTANGNDIVYAVRYFKGQPVTPPVDCGTPVGPCPQASPFYAEGDVNGNCIFNGIDLTYYVRFLKLQVPSLLICPSCPPATSLAPAVIPALAPKVNIQHSAGQ